MKRLLLMLVAVLALSATPALADPSGAISGGTANDTWTSGHVDNFHVAFDLCGSDGSSVCKWAGLAWVQPASDGGCAADPFSTPTAKLVWSTGTQAANGAFDSGPRDFPLNGAYGQRVCLGYWRHFDNTGIEATYYLDSKLLQQPPAPQPTPTPEPTPTPTPTPTPAPTPDPNRLVRCSGSAYHGFIRGLTERRTTCADARDVMRAWARKSLKASRNFYKRPAKVLAYTCRFKMLHGGPHSNQPNSYGRITCTASSKRFVGFFDYP